MDIYAQYRFLDPGIFGTSFARFRQRFAVMGGYGGHQITGYQNESELSDRIYSIAMKAAAGARSRPQHDGTGKHCGQQQEHAHGLGPQRHGNRVGIRTDRHVLP